MAPSAARIGTRWRYTQRWSETRLGRGDVQVGMPGRISSYQLSIQFSVLAKPSRSWTTFDSRFPIPHFRPHLPCSVLMRGVPKKGKARPVARPANRAGTGRKTAPSRVLSAVRRDLSGGIAAALLAAAFAAAALAFDSRVGLFV